MTEGDIFLRHLRPRPIIHVTACNTCIHVHAEKLKIKHSPVFNPSYDNYLIKCPHEADWRYISIPEYMGS